MACDRRVRPCDDGLQTCVVRADVPHPSSWRGAQRRGHPELVPIARSAGSPRPFGPRDDVGLVRQALRWRVTGVSGLAMTGHGASALVMTGCSLARFVRTCRIPRHGEARSAAAIQSWCPSHRRLDRHSPSGLAMTWDWCVRPCDDGLRPCVVRAGVPHSLSWRGAQRRGHPEVVPIARSAGSPRPFGLRDDVWRSRLAQPGSRKVAKVANSVQASTRPISAAPRRVTLCRRPAT